MMKVPSGLFLPVPSMSRSHAMRVSRLKFSILSFVALLAAPAIAGAVVVTNAQELITAIEDRETAIQVDGVIEFDARYQATNNALPVIDYRVVEIQGGAGAELRASASGFRLLEVIGEGRVVLADQTISGFATAAPGGAILVDDADLDMNQLIFRDNHSGRNGGALHVQRGFPRVRAVDTLFEANSAGLAGGAVSLLGINRAQLAFSRTRLIDNEAPVGCAVSMRRSYGGLFADSLFSGNCDQALVDMEFGRQSVDFLRNTFLAGSGQVVNYHVHEVSEPVPNGLYGNVVVREQGSGSPLCTGEVTGEPERAALDSLGGNVGMDDSCGLTEESDVLVDDASQVLAGLEPVADGPAVDALDVPRTIVSNSGTRCSIADVNGLGRPQDGDGDGEPACDIGAVEAQNGPDIGPAQSGAYFDPDRNGEGYFVEILEDGRAWVTLFSYTPGGGSPVVLDSVPAWFHGLGRVVGNSIVVPQFHSSWGGHFGEAFDPEAITSGPIGGLSLVFPSCESGPDSPGTSFFRSNQGGLADVPVHSDVFARAVRLSSILECRDEPAGPMSGRSGNFYAPERAGEGIQVQWLPDGRVFAAWYTFNNEGGQLWMISESSEIEGDTVTLSMVYPAESTAFGSGFNPEEIELESWGTLTLQYINCDTVEFSFDSVVEGFGSGSYTYQRLTRPAGTVCNL